MKIVLIGFMGAGKSSVAALLSQRLGLSLVDTDELIRQRTGVADLSQIFSQKGEPHFRALEAEVAVELGPKDNLVVSTGGGFINHPESMRILCSSNSRVYFLKTSFDVAKERIGADTTRFLFRDPARAQQIFEQRQPLYAQAAQHTVVTDARSPADVCEEICNNLASYQTCTESG